MLFPKEDFLKTLKINTTNNTFKVELPFGVNTINQSIHKMCEDKLKYLGWKLIDMAIDNYGTFEPSIVGRVEKIHEELITDVYTVVSGSSQDELIELVQSHIIEGFKVTGGIAISANTGDFYQAMIKKATT